MNELIIGDSFVEGVGAPFDKGWAFLYKKNVKKNILISGVGGDNIQKINERIEKLPNTIFDVVILEIGLNDSRYRPSKQENEIPKNEFLLELNKFSNYFFKKNKNVKIVILGLTKVNESLACPYKDDKYYINGNIEVYNNYLREFSLKYDFQFIDLHNLLNNELLSDGLHPNKKGHEELFNYIKRKLK